MGLAICAAAERRLERADRGLWAVEALGVDRPQAPPQLELDGDRGAPSDLAGVDHDGVQHAAVQTFQVRPCLACAERLRFTLERRPIEITGLSH